MRKVTLGGHTVQLYDSIDELPMVRFHKYTKMLLVDAGVGSDINDFDRHIERAALYIRKGDNENAAKEMENLRQNVYLILQEQSVRDLSFACLVAAIDGKECADLSDDSLAEVLHMLGGAPRKDIADSLESAKKKIDGELATYFPDLFDDVAAKEYYDIMKRRTLAVLQGIIDDNLDEFKQQVDEMTERMILYMNPKSFVGKASIEIHHDKSFEDMCLLITRDTHADAKKMTVLEFYNGYEFIVRQAKKANKAR